MKGRRGRRANEPFSLFESLSSVRGERTFPSSLPLSLSLFFSRFFAARANSRSFFLRFLLVFHLPLLLPPSLPSPKRSASAQPPNKRTDRVYSRRRGASERGNGADSAEKRRNSHLGSAHPRSPPSPAIGGGTFSRSSEWRNGVFSGMHRRRR